MMELEIFQKENIPDMLRWFSNKNNRRFQITKSIDLEGVNKLIETNDEKIVYCIKLDGMAIGYCMLKKIKLHPEIGINIDEPCWGKGYGKQVLVALEGKARDLNLKKIYLEVFKDNERAVNLYKNAGYFLIKEKKTKERKVLLHLEKELR